MSLHFVIDGCNITHHPIFLTQHRSAPKDKRVELLEFIRLRRLCGSRKNRVTVVFDGYPCLTPGGDTGGIEVVFSQDQTADDRIKKILEGLRLRSEVVVVSDDRQVRDLARMLKARALNVAEFIPQEKKPKARSEYLKPELSFSQIDKINKELEKIWLKD
jgi:predicted RNA-binding protein with PIN domain